MSRALWKAPFIPIRLPKLTTSEPIKTDARSTLITPAFVGRKFLIHNGKIHVPVTITEQMISHKLGEFARTRKPFSYKKKEQKGR